MSRSDKKLSFVCDPSIGLYSDYSFPDDVNCIIGKPAVQFPSLLVFWVYFQLWVSQLQFVQDVLLYCFRKLTGLAESTEIIRLTIASSPSPKLTNFLVSIPLMS